MMPRSGRIGADIKGKAEIDAVRSGNPRNKWKESKDAPEGLRDKRGWNSMVENGNGRPRKSGTRGRMK